MARFGVIGAGIIGLAVARRIAEVRPGAAVSVLDKEHAIALHQTARNSGVVHSGIYYAPGSLKARLCQRGGALLRAYCADRAIPLEACGKLLVAVDAGEVQRLRELRRRAELNGVPGLRWVDDEELREIEPHAAGLAGLHSPSAAITDYAAVARALADDVQAAGGEIHLSAEVTAIRITGGRARVDVNGDQFEFDRLVICAGLYADRVARMAGDDPGPAIVPFRGEYYQLIPERSGLVRGLLYPVPDPAYPFLGIHFTRSIDGSVKVGPNAVLALAREGYRRRTIRPRDLVETVTWRGFRVFARSNWRMGTRELLGSLSKRAFVGQARRYVPEITAADLVTAQAGVRAQALDDDGSLVDDFRIHNLGPVVAVRNAPSPGATSSLAIAEHVVEVVLDDNN